MVIFGQDPAIETLASAIKLARSGLANPDKPIGNFLFAGPTGVGKTEVTKQLAMQLGIELVRFDMSEYMESHSVSRLIGAPPGYVGFDQGGLLTEKIVKTPHCVLLLDEIEKAHPDIFNILLQVMDRGVLTDTNGREANFQNVILVMTTNAGAAQAARRTIGFTQQDHATDAMEVIRKSFTPGVPQPPGRGGAVPGAGLRPHPARGRQVPDRAGGAAAREARGADRHADARATGWPSTASTRRWARGRWRGCIQDKIKRPLADELLFGKLVGGGRVTIDVRDGELVVEAQAEPEKLLPATVEYADSGCQSRRNEKGGQWPPFSIRSTAAVTSCGR